MSQKDLKENKKVLLLPMSQTQLCFDKNDFVKKDFCVDQFVSKCRQKVSLETLRENLEVYFKLLKNAMIELINKDYADFVNLSSNLVGMDKSIESVREPLNKVNTVVTTSQEMMDGKCGELEEALVRQSELKQKKKLLKHMKGLIDCVDKIEHIQNSEDDKSDQMSERIAGEFNQLQHHAVFCKSLPILQQLRPRISEITGKLEKQLIGELLEGISNEDAKKIHKCLNSYSLIGKTKHAENIVKEYIVRPNIKQIIDDHECNDKLSPANLKVLFSKILDFLSHNLRFLCDITCGRKTKCGEQFRGILGYDFTVNSAWPAIFECIENHLEELFAITTSDTQLYLQRYQCFMEFLCSFERMCGSQASISRLRSCNQYEEALSKWNLPIYFQLRFEKIGRLFISGLKEPTAQTKEENSAFRLQMTSTLWKCIQNCWNEDNFLLPLLDRFWKLNLQLISRYNTWVKSVTNSTNNQALKIDEIAALIHDFTALSEKMNKMFEDVITANVSRQKFKDIDLLKNALDSQLGCLHSIKSDLTDRIVNNLVESSVAYIKQAKDVPRLYRNTNRATPTEASSYVSQIVKSPLNFHFTQAQYMDNQLLSVWMSEYVQNISDKYFTVVSETLTQIRKMEESLMRLKRVRKGGKSQQNSPNEGKETDDDKIRRQLFIDVEKFGENMKTCGVDLENNEKYQELFKLVQNAQKK